MKDADLGKLLAAVARQAGVRVQIDATIHRTVSADMEGVDPRVALGILAERAGCVLLGDPDSGFRVEDPPRVYGHFPGESIEALVASIARRAGVPIALDPGVHGSMAMPRTLTWHEQLEVICRTLGYELVLEGDHLRVQQHQEDDDLVVRSWRIHFARPEWPQVTYALRMVLTPGMGEIRFDEDSCTLTVWDVRPVTDEVQSILTQLALSEARRSR